MAHLSFTISYSLKIQGQFLMSGLISQHFVIQIVFFLINIDVDSSCKWYEEVILITKQQLIKMLAILS